MTDDHRNQRLSIPSLPLRPLREESDDSDGSWTLYSIYSHIAEKEDTEMVERCQKDADGTLIFVSPGVSSQRTPQTYRET